jgi:hypothetical protein
MIFFPPIIEDFTSIMIPSLIDFPNQLNFLLLGFELAPLGESSISKKFPLLSATHVNHIDDLFVNTRFILNFVNKN